jgi:hypothetical protein
MKVHRLGFRMTMFGLLGLFGRQALAWLSGTSMDDPTRGSTEDFLMWFFIGPMLGGMFLVLPLAALLYRRAERVDRAEGLISSDAPPRQWELPGWIGWPLWAIVTAGSLFLLYGVMAYGIPAFFERGR